VYRVLLVFELDLVDLAMDLFKLKILFDSGEFVGLSRSASEVVKYFGQITFHKMQIKIALHIKMIFSNTVANLLSNPPFTTKSFISEKSQPEKIANRIIEILIVII